MSTPTSPYGELPPTHDAEIRLDVKGPHDLLLCTAGGAALIGALVVLPIKKVR